jgi:hypothetical protein
VYNSAGVQSTAAVLELAGDQGSRQPPQDCISKFSAKFKNIFAHREKVRLPRTPQGDSNKRFSAPGSFS